MKRNQRFLVFMGFCALIALVMQPVFAAPPPGKGPGNGGGGGGKGGETVSHTARQERPISLGVSGGNVVDLANGYCCSGTLGALVEDSAGVQYILSNTHVLAGDSVLGGNGLVAQVGDPINQPGYIDIACQDIGADYVATLTNWADLVPGGYGVVDAAIAEVLPGAVDPSGSILEIGTISNQTLAASLDLPVKKSGRTSGLTRGKIAALDVTISVAYSDECAGQSYVTTFTGQIIVTPGKFIKGGDSGSLMVEDLATNPRAVGLLYAGSKRVAIAAPIDDVLDYFDVTMVGVDTGAAAASAGESTAVQRASKAKAANANRLMRVPGAVGHAVGLTGNAPVVQVLVEKITPAAQQAKPAKVDGVPVVLMEVGKVVAY